MYVAIYFIIAHVSDEFDAAAHEQRNGHGRQTAHGVRTRLLHVAQNENADGAQRPERNAHAHADELALHALREIFFVLWITLSRYAHRPETKKKHKTIAVHR